MSSMAEYFRKNRPQPIWQPGDRVFGRWNKIPFVGSVGNDRVVSEAGPEVTIHLDLPIHHNGKTHNILVVKHRDIRPLVAL